MSLYLETLGLGLGHSLRETQQEYPDRVATGVCLVIEAVLAHSDENSSGHAFRFVPVFFVGCIIFRF